MSTVLEKAGKTFEVDADALDAIVREGYSQAYGAGFLKRVIDDRIKLPISTNWHEAHFHVRVDGDGVGVDSKRFAPAAQAVA